MPRITCGSAVGISVEKLKSTLVDEVNNEATAEKITFQYISVQKMEYVLRVARRKIEKEKEQKVLLEFLTKNTNNDSNSSFNGRCSECNENERFQTEIINCKTLIKTQKLNQPLKSGHISKTKTCNIGQSRSHYVSRAVSNLQKKLTKEIGTEIPNVKKGVSLIKSSQQHPNLELDSRKSYSVKTVISKKSDANMLQLPVPNTVESEKIKEIKSKIFFFFCADLLNQLENIEQVEKRSWQHLKAALPQSQSDFHKIFKETAVVEKTDRFATSMPIQTINKKNRTETNTKSQLCRSSMRLDSKTMRPTNNWLIKDIKTAGMKVYGADTNCILIARLSNNIIDEMLNELCAEMNDLPDLFLSELFKKEFHCSC